MTDEDVWSGFSGDPRQPSTGELRASDADRDHAGAVLRDAYADGRLTREEYEQRSGAVLVTRTLAGLVPLIGDLVPVAAVPPTRTMITPRSRAVEKYDRELRDARNRWALVSVLTIGIWIATSIAAGGAYFFWPVFPVLGVGIGYVTTRVNRESRIEAIEDNLGMNRRRTDD